MNVKIQPLQFYNSKNEELERDVQRLKKVSLYFAIARLTVFAIAVALVIYLVSSYSPVFWIFALIGIILFLFIVKRHQKIEKKIAHVISEIAIVKNERAVILERENSNYDGSKFINDSHNYSSDLDVFGSFSLFGIINRCKTFGGLEQLAAIFINSSSQNEIELRREAIRELEKITSWRINFFAHLYNIKNGDHVNDTALLNHLLNMDLSFATNGLLTLYRKSLPLIWLAILISYFIYPSLCYGAAIIIGLLNFRISSSYAIRVSEVQNTLSIVGSKLDIYSNAIKQIYDCEWKSHLLKKLISKSGEGNLKSNIQAISELNEISNLLDYRLNVIISIILNLGFLWDSRIVFQLSEWGKEHSLLMDEIFHHLGAMESLSSLATWNYNNPSFVNPVLSSTYFEFDAKNICHPLMKTELVVANDFVLNKNEFISIVTGSNMSGKSTFLRTIGLNMVLGNSGAKVSASELKYGLVTIVTYMRIKDALEEDVSTFKAELLRVEKILNLLDDDIPVLILADEMLRGTNSKDKLLGSKAIINRISQKKAYALIATHDLDLTKIDLKGLKNYHFDISFSDQGLAFDYKIKEGICDNFNASYLLKELGLEIS